MRTVNSVPAIINFTEDVLIMYSKKTDITSIRDCHAANC